MFWLNCQKCQGLRYITYRRTHVHTRTQDLVHYILHIGPQKNNIIVRKDWRFAIFSSFTHPPSLLPLTFYHTFLPKMPLNFQDTKRHLVADNINRRFFLSPESQAPFCAQLPLRQHNNITLVYRDVTPNRISLSPRLTIRRRKAAIALSREQHDI